MADSDHHLILLLLALFQLKHFICDGPLQTAKMVRDKGHYGRWLGIVHAFYHGLGSLVVLLLMGVDFQLVVGLAALDMALHYHIDFSKEQIVRRAGWATSQPQFWWALSADQTLHQLTYILLTALAFKVF